MTFWIFWTFGLESVLFKKSISFNCEQNEHNAVSGKKSIPVCWCICEKLLISG